MELYKSAGVPIISTSANISKEPPVISVEEAVELSKKMDNKIDAIIKGKKSYYNKPTTIVDTTTDPPTVLRKGLVALDILKKVIPNLHVIEEE